MKILLVIIGNSQVKACWLNKKTVRRTSTLNHKLLVTFLQKFKLPDFVCILSVVPMIAKITQNYFDKQKIPNHLLLHNNLPHPQQIGLDRLLAAQYAAQLLNQKVCVIDFGTATTFTLMAKNLNFLGGFILPGFQTAFKALIANTALLPKTALKAPLWHIPRKTGAAMQTGHFWGTIGQIESLIKKIKQTHRCQIILTGGLAKYFSTLPYRHEPHLLFMAMESYLKNKNFKCLPLGSK